MSLGSPEGTNGTQPEDVSVGDPAETARETSRHQQETTKAPIEVRVPPKDNNKHVGVLHRSLEEAIEYGRIQRPVVTKHAWTPGGKTVQEAPVVDAGESLRLAILTQLVTGIRFGELRALRAGQKMIATMLGHADTSATERYTHVQVDATRRLVEERWKALSGDRIPST